MHRFYCFFLILILPLISSFAQTPAQRVEIQSLIDQPTAGSLEKGEYGFDVRFFPQGGTLVGLQAGMFSRFMIGVSYGGVNIIGNGQPEWNELPGVLVKYRVFEESDFPALSIGFDSQGYGMYYDFADRYEFKAKGLFAVISKNYSMGYLGFLGIHGGVNYNTFENDDDRNVTGFMGLDKSINDQISVLAEYSLGFDDDAAGALGRDRGYLNAGVRWVFAGQLGVEFNFKDILENRKDINAISR
ncbi:YjbH domain-containing protein, partial [bacterium]|nr:YjbH domain-containing protein [bacterium]